MSGMPSAASSPQVVPAAAAIAPAPREAWIDVARGIGILLVAIGHAPIPDGAIGFISGCHVPLFFALAGWSLGASRDGAPGFARAKARALLLPYATTVVVCLPIWLALRTDQTWTVFEGRRPSVAYLGALLGNATWSWGPASPSFGSGPLAFDSPLWFLPALWCALVVFHAAATRLARRPATLVALSALAAAAGIAVGHIVFLPWGLDIALAMQPFLLLGWAWRRGGARAVAPLAALGVAVVLGYAYTALMRDRDVVAVCARGYGGLTAFYGTAAVGIAAVAAAAMVFARLPILGAAIGAIGRRSLAVLLYHRFLTFALVALAGRILRARTLDWYLANPTIVAIGSVAAAIALGEAVARHPRLARFALGRAAPRRPPGTDAAAGDGNPPVPVVQAFSDARSMTKR